MLPTWTEPLLGFSPLAFQSTACRVDGQVAGVVGLKPGQDKYKVKTQQNGLLPPSPSVIPKPAVPQPLLPCAG